jgi:hypothetical protein
MKPNPFALLASAFAALLLLPWYWDHSLLIGFGIAAVGYAITDMERSLQAVPVPLAHLAVVLSGLQLVIAPWLTQYYPDENPANQIPPGSIGLYMDFAVPAVLAFAAGLVLAQSWFFQIQRPMAATFVMPLDRVTERAIQLLFAGSFLLMVAGHYLSVPSALAFFVLLLSEIALVCPLMLFFSGRAYWWKLAVLPLGWKLIGSIEDTVFHTFLLWVSVYVLVYWSVRFHGRNFRYVLLAGLIGVMILQPAKTFFRDHGGGFLDFGSVMIAYLSNPTRAYSEDNLSRTLMRLNQGWILYRVMTWVPEYEPYAGDEILARQLTSVLPRFLAPGKYSVGGAEHFEQYTGHHLWGGTSMGLGYAGELYASFGKRGGIIAIWIYGLVFGAALARLRLAAWHNPLWYAWGPYMFLVAVKAEDSIGNAFNWALKAWVTIVVVRYGFERIFWRRRFLAQHDALTRE